MADTAEIKWIYPPNWNGEANPSGYRRVTVLLTGISDGSGETDVVKVNLSEWITKQKAVPTKTVIEKIEWQIHGLTAVLEWDRVPDIVIVRLNSGIAADSDTGSFDWTKDGGLADEGTGGTGDIKLTTSNVASGDSYNITITLRFK